MKYATALILLAIALPLAATDPYPRACVDCHGKGKVPKMSAVMERLKSSSDPALVAALQPLAPKGITLKGRHPNSATATGDIPNICVKCHSATSRLAPPFAQMMHVMHWQKVDDCTTCHKPIAATGLATVPSGPEK